MRSIGPHNKAMQLAGMRLHHFMRHNAAADLNSYTYQVKVVLVALMLTMSLPSAACFSPRKGDKFDALLQVTLLESNVYQLSFPYEAGDLNYGASATLTYYKDVHFSSSGGRYRVPELEYPIDLEVAGGQMTATLKVKSIIDHTPFIVVFWAGRSGGECGAFGFSDDLVDG